MRNYACAVEPAFAKAVTLRKNATCKEEIFRENSFRDYSSQYLGTLTCIKRRIGLLRAKHINRRKQHVLRPRKHLRNLHELQSKYVLVPADKAANNVIVVCKKYYLEVVMKEITETSTYEQINKRAAALSLNVVNE